MEPNETPEEAPPVPLGAPSPPASVAGSSPSSPSSGSSLALNGLFVMALIVFAYVGKAVLMPLAFAFLVGLVLRPSVRLLSRMKIPASISAAVVLLGILGSMGFGVVSLSEPAVEWAERMPHALKVVERRTRPLLQPMENVSEIAGSVDRLIQVDKSHTTRKVELDRPGLMELGFGVIVELVMGAVVMFIALYFMLVARQESLTRMLGLAHHDHTASMAATMLPRLEQQVSRYLRVVAAINVSLGVAVGVSLMLLGMPNPALWGALAAVLTFIPYLGPMVGVGAVALASIVTFPDLSQAMEPPLVYMALATLEGHLITPLVLGSRLKVSPLILFVWLVFWGALWGIGGAVLAAPMLALIKLACDQNPAWIGVARWLEG